MAPDFPDTLRNMYTSGDKEALTTMGVFIKLENMAQTPPSRDNLYTPANGVFYYPTFRYQKPDRGKHFTRLVELPIAAGGGPIDKVTLKQISGKYSALSYCAGDLKKRKKIHINRIGLNMFSDFGNTLKEGLWLK